MRTSIKTALGAALVASAQLASAGTASVEVSSFGISASGGEWWYYLPSNVDWLPPTAGAVVQLTDPMLGDSVTAWHGNAASASVADAGSLAHAAITPATSWDLNGVSALAEVNAVGGQSGWAFANVFDGRILVGAGVTLTLTALIADIEALGDMSQANAYLELCTADFGSDLCSPAYYAEAFVDGTSGPYSGPATLSVSWTNPNPSGDNSAVWLNMRAGLTASSASVAEVPEPTSAALALLGLFAAGALTKRRKAG